METKLNRLRLLADPLRLRLWSALRMGGLSVAELQEILGMGQSRISTQLAQLKRAGLVENRRDGRHSIYAACEPVGEEALIAVAEEAAGELEDVAQDGRAVRHALGKRRDRMRAHFDALAGKFGREYVPGRSWKSLAEALLKLMDPLVVADLGAGEGTVSQLLAQRAKQVIAIDNAEKMVAYGRRLAKEHGLKNLDFRHGDIEHIPIDDGTVDLAVFSQALHHAEDPAKAVREARRILKPGGRVVVLDLVRHRYEQARELYADVWLGFAEVELLGLLEEAGFVDVECSVVDREDEPPKFETVFALARKPVVEGRA